MSKFLTLGLACFIAIYGLLLILGGTSAANGFLGRTCRQLVILAQRILNALAHLLLTLFASAIRFVFYRPKR